MPPSGTTQPSTGRLRGVLTDVHFWVPVAVLLMGLVLLSFMR